ncbi:hypothetical protein VPNG_04651 [Cytospora leucostoma]|uniref:Uncharacterized protein n=1 Tax=Cytospora leucostoma TaxID=1230097 RepID=A0A423XAP7_9PEZI|nr:hypothetical protein VPNG_04651 [Cytospora leucostoma]
MNTPDKRGPPASSKGPKHVFRGGSPRREAPASATISAPSAARSNNVGAASSRAQQSRPPSADGQPRSQTSSTHSGAPSTGKGAAITAGDKDMRIASLERELSVMEAEFKREMDKLSKNESETASFWQAKHSALNQQFLRTDTELRLLRDEMREIRARDLGTDAATRGWREALEMELRGRDDEIRGLKLQIRDLNSQVRGLKEWVSASTRADDTTSDEVIGAGMANLGNGLQNWVITNFRKSKIDLPKADEASLQELSKLVPMYEEMAQTSKVHLLQSLVSRMLVQSVFHVYFVGLSPEQELRLRQTEEMLLSLGSVESVNQWRSVTLTMLKKDAAHNMQVQITQTAEDVVTRIDRVLDSITTDTAGKAGSGNTAAANSTDAKNQALRQLVDNAIELSRLLVLQKAVFEVWMPDIEPHQQVIFDHETMEDIGGEDEENLVQREICCVTLPGIIKRGDENGGQLQFRNVISKARVLCSAE